MDDRRTVLLFGTALLMALGGCTQQPPAPPTPAPIDGPNVGGPIHIDPISDAEVSRFGNALEKAVAQKDRARMSELLPMRDFWQRLAVDIGLSEKEAKVFIEEAKQADFADVILKQTQNGITYRFLRPHQVGDRWFALFRLLDANGDVAYHDIWVVRKQDASVVMEDVNFVAIGELFSETMRRTFLPLLAKRLQNLEHKQLKKNDSEILAGLNQYSEYMRATHNGEFAGAVSKFQALPKSLRETKFAMVLLLQAYLGLGEDAETEFRKVAKQFRLQFPNDSSFDMVMVNYYRKKQDVARALAAIDALDKSLGGDPSLLVMKADLLIDSKRYEEAKLLVDEAIRREPDLEGAYWSGNLLSIRQKNHAVTLQWLKKLVDKCGVQIDDLSKENLYADFVKSPQYREWLEWYRNHKKE